MTITAKIIADSVNRSGDRLTTFEVKFPRFIHAQVMTHREWSRNSASSRAIPTKKLIQQVLDDPATPLRWGRNQAGMQAGEDLSPAQVKDAEWLWLSARDAAVNHAQDLLDIGLHKQCANRLLEPFLHSTMIISATEYENFFAQRCHDDAQPEIRELATLMRDARDAASPKVTQWGDFHTPYVTEEERSEFSTGTCNRLSVARCARVSYLNHDGVRSVEDDEKLYQKLTTNGHWCYDEQTEVLTDVGWVLWKDIKSTHHLAAVDVKSKSIHFEQPIALVAKSYVGPMYHLHGQQIDLLVTPNHRMVTSYRQSGGGWSNFHFESAESVAGRPRRYLKSGNLTNALYEKGNPFGIDPVSFWKLVGFFIGDGHAQADKVTFNLRRRRKIEYLKKLNVGAYERGNKFVIDGVGRWFRENCYASDRSKKFPEGVLKIAAPYADALFDGLKNSDGSVKRNTWTYSTTSVHVVDQLQALLHLHGHVGSISKTIRHAPQNTKYTLNVSSRITPRIEPNVKGRSLSYTEEWCAYNGTVYCATVTTGAVMVRRHGKVCVSGNSPFEHVASACPGPSGNFRGWAQLRKSFSTEYRGRRR